MRLILSTRHPRNSTYSTGTGEILYKVDKPLKLGSTVATIRKAIGTVNGVWSNGSEHLKARAKSPIHDEDSDIEKGDLIHDEGQRPSSPEDEAFADSDSEDDPSGSGVPVFEGHFAFFAQVNFKTFKSTRFCYNGLDVPVSEYFRKEGWSWYGRGRVFKAADGKEYRWQLRAGNIDMITNDGSKTQVVKFKGYRPSLGSFLKGRPATLEIDPTCVPILDEIIMTFIYCHKLKKDRERRSRNSGGGAGP